MTKSKPTGKPKPQPAPEQDKPSILIPARPPKK